MTPHRDDIPITDYAFGELTEAQRQAVEESLSTNPDAKLELEQMLSTAEQLKSEFDQEFTPDIGLDESRKKQLDRKIELLDTLHARRKFRPAHYRNWYMFIPLGLIAIVLILILLIWYSLIP